MGMGKASGIIGRASRAIGLLICVGCAARAATFRLPMRKTYPAHFMFPVRATHPTVLTFLILCLTAGNLQAADAIPVALERHALPGDFDQPTVVAAGEGGEVYALDGTRGRVVVIADGRVARVFGKPGKGSGELNRPLDLALADKLIWIADTGNHRIAVFRRDGGFVRALELKEALRKPSPSGRGLGEGLPNQSIDTSPDGKPENPPEPVALAVRDGILAWSDRRSHRLCRIRLDDQAPLGCTGERGENEGQFQFPYQIAADRDGYWQVIDILNARVQVFDRSGRFFSQVGRFGLDEGELYRPNGLAIDAARDIQYIADSYFGWISLFRNGEYLGKLADATGATLKFDSPTGLHFRDGKLYVAETGASKVWELEIGSAPLKAKPKEKGVKPLEVSQKNCVLCHLSWANEAPDALKRPDHAGALTDSSFAMCYSCHNGAVMDSRLAIHRGAQHPTLYDRDAAKLRRKKAGERKDKFPDAFPKNAQGEMSCGTCHTPHTDQPGEDKLYAGHHNTWLRWVNRGGDLCERCHESKAKRARDTEPAKRGLNHPLAVKLESPPFAGAAGYASMEKLHAGLPEKIGAQGGAVNKQNELVCQSCHQIHGGEGERQMLTLVPNKGDLCTTCHERQNSASKEDAHKKGIHPVNFKPEEEIELGKEKVEFLTCQTCHKVHDGKLGTPLLPNALDLAESKSGPARSNAASPQESTGEQAEIPFVAREKAAAKPETALARPDDAGTRAIENLCQSCHQRQHAEGKDEAREKGVHPVNEKLDEPVKIGDRKIETVGCLSCHAVHRGKPNTAALIEDDKNGELCSHCHKDKQTVVGSDHDLRIVAKDKLNRFEQLPAQSGVCGACHTLHQGRGLQSRLSAVKWVAGVDEEHMDPDHLERDRLCLNCHQKGGLSEKKIVRRYSHPHDDMVLRSDQGKMPLLGAGEKIEEFGQIACITCHEPHVWKTSQRGTAANGPIAVSDNTENLEGRNLDSFLRHKGVKGTFCVSCHGMEGLAKYKYFHDQERARSKGVDYLR
jgi:predicted CXXCH cytochrome family protein